MQVAYPQKDQKEVSAMKNEGNDPRIMKQQPRQSRGVSRKQEVLNKKPQRPKKSRIEKQPLDPERVRTIKGSFAFIEHRFLRDGFWAGLDPHQLLLYLFLVLVADRNGLSYYSFDKICTLVGLSLDEYIEARNDLIAKNLIASNGHLFQVLSLPEQVVSAPVAKSQDSEIRQLIDRARGKSHE